VNAHGQSWSTLIWEIAEFGPPAVDMPARRASVSPLLAYFRQQVLARRTSRFAVTESCIVIHSRGIGVVLPCDSVSPTWNSRSVHESCQAPDKALTGRVIEPESAGFIRTP